MGIEIDSNWTPQRLISGSTELTGYMRRSGTLEEESLFLAEHLGEVVAQDGALFQRFHEVSELREVVHPGGYVGYQCDPPDIEMWYFPQCSFEESLGLLDGFGFPSRRVCSRPEEVRFLSKNLLREIAKTRRIALSAITPEAVTVENFDPETALGVDEINGVLEFNQRHFGVHRNESEARDLRGVFRKKDFFVLGHM
jgi:hypothetical protein